MSKLILSNEANCQYCYKCLRHCYVKSIRFNSEASEVIEEDCIDCGTCIDICPQQARDYLREQDQLASFFGKPFLVSIAPSFFAHFESPFLLIGYLKKMGAVVVQETALGADMISDQYARWSKERMQPMVSTACPVVVELAQKFFPEALPFLAPYVSPMVAHAKYLRKYVGDLPALFLGPCIAKKKEGSGVYDLVLTFDEIETFLKDEKTDLSTFEESLPTPPYPQNGRLYPFSGGIHETLEGRWSQSIVVEGLEQVGDLFQTLPGIQEPFFFEASSCAHGCIDGPGIRKDHTFLSKRSKVIQFNQVLQESRGKPLSLSSIDLDLSKSFQNEKQDIQFDESDIVQVLNSIGKKGPQEELNCGACGYNTCREKAKAVLVGKAEKEMCMSYMIERMTSVSNLVAEETPNIVVIRKDDQILYVNRSARSYFSTVVDSDEQMVQEIKKLERNQNRVFEDKRNGRIFLIKGFDLPNGYGKVLILTDMTKEKIQEEKIRVLKKETISKVDIVLDKQMRLAQEIAGLLGESIAEAKSHFVEFKRYMEDDHDHL